MSVPPSPATGATGVPEATPSTPASAPMVLMLSLLMGLQPVTTDLYLPALPALTAGFGAPMSQAQLTLTALLLSFGLSQLVWGPLSDRFGRRPILLLGLSAYVLAALASTLAPTMDWLIAWRALQGAAMGAGVMGARALIRDLYTPLQGARVMSKGLSGLGLIALVSPPLGGWLAGVFSWRMALLMLAIFGAATLALVIWRFDESLRHKNPLALHPRTLARTWRTVLGHPTFWAYSMLSAASYGGLFTFLAASSFVFIQVLGLSTSAYGLLMSLNALLYVGGTVLCRRLLPRLGVRRTLAWAGAVSLLAGTSMGVLALAGVHTPWAIMLPQCLYMLGHGIHQPCSQSGAVGPFPQAAGVASALNGFGMMLAAFVMGGWLGRHMDGTVMPLALGVWFWSAAVALSAWTLVQRYGHMDEH